ncbi:MAG: alpha-L-rhamnosidase C-terminal domain-containing protein [Bacteroidota bacterium]|nr:alpha-L-rhamnosidase C-terminal domain-containing protein [Bacteroidota bacterium]
MMDFKKNLKRIAFAFFFWGFLFKATATFAQLTVGVNPDILSKEWAAKWITCPGISGKEYGVYLFRKDFNLDSEPNQFIVHVSGDNRYKLYVNGKQVCNGPARGDLLKWNFETIDIASYLKKGKNIITAEVWNFAEFRPGSQVSSMTGFILQGNTDAESLINTDNSWVVFRDLAYSPIVGQLWIIGPNEKIDGELHPWNWMQPDFDYSGWNKSRELEKGRPLNSLGLFGGTSTWVLQPRAIPAMEQKMQRFSSIRRSDLPKISDSFLRGEKALTIPAHTKTKILIDQKILTNAYPVLNFSKGKKSEIRITYAEALIKDKNKKEEKGNRDDIDQKIIDDYYYDIILADGGDNRTFESLWFRPFRYVELAIETKDEPLIINDFYSIFTGYPFEEKASFKCDDPIFTNIWNVGWRTQRLCAMETYWDCPYYEQQQYVGDTRIQALVSTYMSGDFRLVKHAISSLHDSRLPCGITRSAYPGSGIQVIPPFSLVWNTMVNDYWMLNGDKEFVKSMIPGMMESLNWFESRMDTTTGMIGHTEWWNFVDWANFKNWLAGCPPGAFSGNSAILSLQYVYTLQKTAILFKAFGMQEEAARYLKIAESVKAAVYKNCWDEAKGLLADTPEKDCFSQHGNSLAILTNTIPLEKQRAVAENILNNKDIAACTLYFSFYLTEAVEKAGLSDRYPDMLGPWVKMLGDGLTTFAEVPGNTRSDCHAWSASPVYYFLSLICGIKPNEPGFKSVRIEPHLGRLNWIEGSMPHQLGTIKVCLKKDKQNNITGEVTLPENLTGTFVWDGQVKSLKGGPNQIQIKSNKKNHD